MQPDLFETWRWIAEADDEGTRLDVFLRDQDVGLTRSQLKKLIDNGLAEICCAPQKAGQRLKAGDAIALYVPPPDPVTAVPEDIALDVRFEDDFLLVVNKPQGLVVHPAPGHPRGTLINGVLFGRTTRGGDPIRPGIVHRLDKDTSGLMVVAKREDAHASLARQFHEHTVDRRYQVLVQNSPPPKGRWRTLHGRAPSDRRRFSSKVLRGREAISDFELIARFSGAALLKVTLHTGRTHQVRVHCHDHGFPVLGDPLYGPRHLPEELQAIHQMLPGQALHAELLGFDHPETAERLVFESSPPDAFLRALSLLRELAPARK